jgi:colanic acid/amylovoran biosynthesis glycosyltransferase
MSDKLKVAYILSRFPKLTETFILREMYWLPESGIEVHIFSLLNPLPTPVHQQAEELMPNVHYSPFFLSWSLILAQFHFIFRSPVGYLRALLRAIWQTYREPLVLLRVLLLFPKSVYFARQMEDLGVDHVHAHFVWVNGVAASIASDLIGVTFSLHPHAFGLFMRDQVSVRRQLERADKIVTVSEFHRAYIAALSSSIQPDDVEIVHYGLQTDGFQPSASPVDNKTPHILSVGSLTEKKGHEYLIDACVLLAEKGYDFQCSIIGVGPLQESLQARINRYKLQDKVHLLGGKKQDEVLDLYRQSDIFALACVVAQGGDRDGMPNVLIEAMAMQLPVVTTPVTGIPELVRDGENGLLVPEREGAALAQALERLIQDEPLRRELGRRGRETVLNGFEVRQTAAKLAAVFYEVKSLGR